MNCPWCNGEVPENASFCGNCGKRIPRCPTCGKLVGADTRFCDEDGTRIPEEILALFTADATVRVRPAQETQENTLHTPVIPPQPAYEPPQPVVVPPVVEPTVYVSPVQPADPYADQPEQPRKKSGNGVAIFFVLLLAVLVLVGGYFVADAYFGWSQEEETESSSRDTDEEKEKGDKGDKTGEEEENGNSTVAPKPDATKPTESTQPTQPAEPVVTYEYRYEIIAGDVSWSEAYAECVAKGGYLATIDSPEEYEKICRLAEEFNASRSENTQMVYLWMGAYLPANSTQWKWTTGEPIPMSDYYWYKNEPSYEDNGVREDCLCLWDLAHNGYDWTLNDQRNDIVQDFPSLSGKVGYICEYKIEVRQ